MQPSGKSKKRRFRLAWGGPSLSFTALGTRFIIITLAVGVAAVNSGSNLLYLVVAMMLSMTLLSGILSERALKGLSVRRRLPAEIYAGEPFEARVTVEGGAGRLTGVGLEGWECPFDGVEGLGAFALRLNGGAASASAARTVENRGRWRISGFEISTRFPFGFFRKSIMLPRAEAVTVYPRIVPLPVDAFQASVPGSGSLSALRKGQRPEGRTVRGSLFPDESRAIHWKASAKLGEMVVKEFEAEEGEAVYIILDNAL